MAEQVARGRRAAVAAGHAAEVEAALVTLEAGGNAIDAMVAGAFCACVVEPNNAGLAGYGHLSVWLPEQREFFTVDHGPRAPAAATDDMFTVTGAALRARDAWPHVEGRESELGGLATAVPGAVAGLCAAHRRGGRLPLAVVLEPAIAAADAGVAVDWHLGLTILQRLHDIRLQPSAAAVLLQNGDPPTGHDDWGRGSRLDTSALAGTLRAIAEEGESAFTDLERAQYIERAVAEAGGILTAADVAAYVPRLVAETPTRYRGWNLTTAEDDLGHELFGVLASFSLGELDPGSARELHLLAEAFGHVFVDALAWSGDPSVTPEISAALRDPAYARIRADAIDGGRAAPRPLAAGAPIGTASPASGSGGVTGTTQVAVIDGDGMAAVVITTIGQDFGCLVHVPETGLFLNTGMANYDPVPGRVNSIAPGKMPLFGVPAVLATNEDDVAVLACGGSGGYRITSSVVHSTINALDHDASAGDAVSWPRVWSQGEETYVDDRLPRATLEALEAMGHTLVPQPLTPAYEPFARVSLVRRHADGTLEAASDPPWHGAAGAL